MLRIPTALAAAAFVIGLSAATSSPAVAQQNSNSLLGKALNSLLGDGIDWAEVKSFDISGVKLGMSTAEARAALEARGFTLSQSDATQPSWEARLSSEVAKRRNTPVDESTVSVLTHARGPQGDTVDVWYAATPEGPVVYSVSYSIPKDNLERRSFFENVHSKYGTPTVTGLDRTLYCTKFENSCRNFSLRGLPYLEAAVDISRFHLELKEGREFQKNLDDKMAAALEATAPRNAVPSF